MASLAELREQAERFSRMDARDSSQGRAIYNQVVSGVHEMMASIDRLVAEGVPRPEIADAAAPARQAMAASPFAARLQTWPRGYPGDFETIEYLVDAINTAEPDTLGYYCERFFLSTPPAVQHREKLRVQADCYRSCVSVHPDARILVLAVGGGRCILPALDDLLRSRATLVVVDMDADALALCGERLAPFGDRCEQIRGNPVRLLSRYRSRGPFDLVVAGGLFDYVPQGVLQWVVPTIVNDLLRPGGRFFFTNIADGNPYRSWMEYFASWDIIERSASDIEQLVEPVRDACRLQIRRDTSGLTWLVDVERRG